MQHCWILISWKEKKRKKSYRPQISEKYFGILCNSVSIGTVFSLLSFFINFVFIIIYCLPIYLLI